MGYREGDRLPNRIETGEGTARIYLRTRRQVAAVALVDESDLPLVADYTWTLLRDVGGRAWAMTSIYRPRRRSLLMHRLLMDPGPGMVVDHINHDGLDNRRVNLRVCAQAQNMANMRPQARDTSSRYKGVGWDKRSAKWRAYITIGGRLVHLGYHATEEDGARAYDAAARLYFGEYAFLNFPV